MCKPSLPSPGGSVEGGRRLQAVTSGWMLSSLPRPRRVSTAIGFILALTALALVVLYYTSMSFRRTFIFWKGMAPIYLYVVVIFYTSILEYKWIKWRKPSLPTDEYEVVLHAYYERAAQSLVNLILQLGGIATKIGQVLATIGQGILPNEIVVALRVLQNGVPAKPYEEVVSIITEASRKKGQPPPSMDDLFEWFDPKPIGAASIAQAHLARLRHNNETVVVKVQYPEVAKQLDADLWNMEKAVMLISPENKELAKSMRERHERELDFTLEADHLRECATNLQAHGVEPHWVRIPRVRNETGLCSTNILVMEYIPGVPLSKILAEEQERLAKALGKSGAGLQKYLTEQLLQVQGDAQDNGGTLRPPVTGAKKDRVSSALSNPSVQTLLQKTAPLWARVFRTYASVRDGMERFGSSVRRAVNPGSRGTATDRVGTKVNLSRVLRTLVHVHGLQMLMDGVYNADPHPGNSESIFVVRLCIGGADIAVLTPLLNQF
eukprot:scaffold6066_cov161-Amphora_coffeaeformis.AAC.7